MNVEIHTLAWPNTDAKLVKAHTDVCKHLGIDVVYTMGMLPHGAWMSEIMSNSKADVVGLLYDDRRVGTAQRRPLTTK